ncbi:MAG: tetratricopeptide repeat protein, partial [Promethearchaeota archaeon]
GRDLVIRYNGTRDPIARLSLKSRMHQLHRVLSQGVRAYYKQKRYRQVLRFAKLLLQVTRVLRARVDRAVTHMNLGRTYVKLGQPEEAFSHFEKAYALLQLQEAPALEARALTHMASALQEMKRYDEAEDHSENAIKLSPTDVVCWLGRAQLMEELERIDEVIACYRHILSLEPDNQPALKALKRLGATA